MLQWVRDEVLPFGVKFVMWHLEMLRPEMIDLKRALIWEFQPRSPQVVVKSKGIPPQNGLLTRLKIYNQLPRQKSTKRIGTYTSPHWSCFFFWILRALDVFLFQKKTLSDHLFNERGRVMFHVHDDGRNGNGWLKDWGAFCQTPRGTRIVTWGYAIRWEIANFHHMFWWLNGSIRLIPEMVAVSDRESYCIRYVWSLQMSTVYFW